MSINNVNNNLFNNNDFNFSQFEIQDKNNSNNYVNIHDYDFKLYNTFNLEGPQHITNTINNEGGENENILTTSNHIKKVTYYNKLSFPEIYFYIDISSNSSDNYLKEDIKIYYFDNSNNH